MRRRTLILATLFAVACSGSNKAKTDDSTDAVTQPHKHALDNPGDGTVGESKCYGNRVPPTNYMQETAFVPADSPNASQEAKNVAVRGLRDKICQGYRCTEIEPRITLWHTGRDSLQVCAMAVIKISDVENFKAAPRKSLDADLAARAAALVEMVDSDGDEPRIGIDNIRDSGIDGGPRAEWLVDRMNAALSKGGALIARIPPDWTGRGLPKGVDAVLRGRITPMHGREAMLEVTWNLDLGRGIKAVDPIAFPELIGPDIDPLTAFADQAGVNPEISLRFDARPGGGLCAGQKTELRLETGDDLHVRVVNLYGEGDRALVIHAPDEPIEGEKPTSLGEFEVVRDGKVPAERFLVMGAKTREGLGPLADVDAPCRLSEDWAKQLSSNRGIPEGAKDYVTSRSYRILEGDVCSQYEQKTMPAGWFMKIPSCF